MISFSPNKYLLLIVIYCYNVYLYLYFNAWIQNMDWAHTAAIIGHIDIPVKAKRRILLYSQ